MKISALRLVLVGVLGVASPALAVPNLTKVDCDKGKTITDALKNASSGDTLLVSGVCRERVTITTDRITLDGQGTAVLSGTSGAPSDFTPVLTVDGARGVVIKGLTVQNSPGEGILSRRGAAFSVVQAQVFENALTGISVGDGSTAELTDTVIQRSNPGLDVYNASSAILRGSIAITHNTGNGVEINGLAVVEIRGRKPADGSQTTVNASNNADVGVVVGSGQLAIFGFPSSAGIALTANDNGVGGIQAATSLFSVFPDTTVTASRNGGFGIRLVAGGAFLAAPSVAGTSTFVIEDNVGAGVSAEQGAGALFRAVRLTVKGNGVGLSGDGAGTLTVVAAPAVPSSISGNTLDVNLGFGTRATFQGVTIGSIVCDATVLIRGTTACP
jgi:hypothetical protein